MDNLDFSAQDGLFAMNDYSSSDNRNPSFTAMPSYLTPGWALTSDVLDEEEEAHRGFHTAAQHNSSQPYSAVPRRHNTPNTSPSSLQNAHGIGLGLAQNMGANNMFQQAWQFQYQPQINQNYSHDSISNSSYDDCSLGAPLDSSPVNCVPLTASMQIPMHVATAAHQMGQYMSMAGPMESMAALAYPLSENSPNMVPFPMAIGGMLGAQTHTMGSMYQAPSTGSPSSSTFEVCSLASSDNGWTAINFANAGASFNNPSTTHAVFNPGETLHIRSDSNSSSDGSEQLCGSYEDMPFPMHSPISEHNTFDLAGSHAMPRLMTNNYHHAHSDHDCSAVHSPDGSSPAVSPQSASARPVANVRARPLSASSASTSPTGTSPPLRRRRSPTAKSAISKTTPSAIKKTDISNGSVVRKSAVTVSNEKRIGRRRGPLRPDQRQQAHEIRKLRACLRCKFLKKTCDKGDPCAGCRPSHARLWSTLR